MRFLPLLLAGLTPAYPATRREAVTDTLHGVKVDDPYRWLEDEKSPEVQAWMTAQQAATRARLDALPGRDALVQRLSALYYVERITAPQRRGAYAFFMRRLPTQEKAALWVRQGERERVLLDPNTWTADGSDSLGSWEPSWDGKRVAFTIHHHNSDEATMYLIDVATGQRSARDVIPGSKYAFASWTKAGDAFVYTWIPTDPQIPTAERPGHQTIKLHRLGHDPAQDEILVDKIGDPTTFQAAQLSKDGHWLIRAVRHGWTSDDLYFRDQRRKGAPWVTLVAGQDAIYSVDAFRDRFYVRTNEGAPRSRVFVVDPAHPARAAWKEIVPERKDAALESSGVVGGRLALLYLKDVVSQLEVHGLDGTLVREVPLPGLGAASALFGEEDQDDASYTFQSFNRPTEIHRTSIARGGSQLYFRAKVPLDGSRIAVEEQFTTSKDGTRLPVFIVHRKDVKPDGTARALMTGYGGFLVAEAPSFQPAWIPWLEQGGVFALAILRGGSEYGEEWHRAGMLLRKQNVFDDFIAVGEYLVKAGWTRPGRLAIRGGSNGGLLVGAAETQRPDLFGAVLCGVPLLDMVRYHLYGSGKTWISEYGSADDPEQFKALHAYSPYHRITAGTRYPPTLILSADSDDRVDPMHARKFAAALQHDSAGGPVLLRIEKNSGHGGADLIRQTIAVTADEYLFLDQNLR